MNESLFQYVLDENVRHVQFRQDASRTWATLTYTDGSEGTIYLKGEVWELAERSSHESPGDVRARDAF